MLKNYTLSFCVTLLLACSNVNGEVPWKKMIIAPSENNYFFAEMQLIKNPACDTGWYSDEKFSNDLNSLIKLLRDGNLYAFKIGMIISECMDGGNLGDLYRAIGVVYEGNPQAFFKVANDNNKTSEELKRMLTMLPLDTVDDIPKQTMTLKNRLKALSSVKGNVAPEIYEYLNWALNSIVTR